MATRMYQKTHFLRMLSIMVQEKSYIRVQYQTDCCIDENIIYFMLLQQMWFTSVR